MKHILIEGGKKTKQLIRVNGQLRKIMRKMQRPETSKHNTDIPVENNTNI